jgi:serine protease inhibitor
VRPVTIRRALCACAVTLASCSSATGPEGAPTALERLPRPLTESESAVLASSNSFAFDILRETLQRDRKLNVLLSPLSASLALSMALNGAAGETQDGMRTALRFDNATVAQINEANESLTELLLGLDTGIDIRIANSIWARRDFPFHQHFFDTARRWYSAQVATLDFTASTAAPTINDWVNRSTQGRITEIVESPLPADAVMYLINAVYFKGSWRDRFDPAATARAPFTRRDGSTITVPMMQRGGPAFLHRTADGVEIVEQAYSRGAFAMTIVLPPAGTDVDGLAGTLDTATWDRWMNGLQSVDMDIVMPKYRLAYETAMNPALIALGMERAFQPRSADFTGMSPEGRDLYISNVKQKTYMDVNEEGTEAAAVTSVEIRVVSMPVRPRVVVDRPFIVAIRERLSGAILFIGRVGDPAA